MKKEEKAKAIPPPSDSIAGKGLPGGCVDGCRLLYHGYSVCMEMGGGVVV